MTQLSRRSLLACALSLAVLPSTQLSAADTPKEIYVDWATYNPVSMLLKDKGFLEKEFAKDGIKVVWVQTNSSSNALQFLNAGSINFGSTAGSAALVDDVEPAVVVHRHALVALVGHGHRVVGIGNDRQRPADHAGAVDLDDPARLLADDQHVARVRPGHRTRQVRQREHVREVQHLGKGRAEQID